MRTPASTSKAALVLAGLVASSVPARGDEASADRVLGTLIEQSLAARPEIQRAEAAVRAERERIPQAGALPDPVLSLGLQNDGFTGFRVGEMETSYFQIMASQGLPWPGKRGLRTEVARLGAVLAETGTRRLQLSTEAEVRRGYLGLMLARERLHLLSRLEGLWQKSLGLAKTRYEAGSGAQSDVLRAQLELNRIRQRRWVLQAEERTLMQGLNRLRAHPLDAPIETPARIGALSLPPVPEEEAAFTAAAERSPELALARKGTERARAQLDLSRKERYPDFGVSAGLMPRGALEPMWQVGASVSLPVWSGRKQSRAVEESAARVVADERSVEAIEQLLRLRVAEWRVALATLTETISLYRGGLLVQSLATAESTLAQYQVGRASFASLLEANAGYIADEEGLLFALADAHRVGIAQAEVSLDPVRVGGTAGMGAAAMPGAGSTAVGAESAASGVPLSSPAPAAGGSSSMSGM